MLEEAPAMEDPAPSPKANGMNGSSSKGHANGTSEKYVPPHKRDTRPEEPFVHAGVVKKESRESRRERDGVLKNAESAKSLPSAMSSASSSSGMPNKKDADATPRPTSGMTD